MIHLRSIHIEEFRGIRVLDINLDDKSFGISGPNGTGKSGVVDAIEFCLTGDVTRLSGQGSGELSVKSHAPHVDQADASKASVTITANIPSLGKTVSIRRTVKNPHKIEISPDDGDVKKIVAELQLHPEFALSRREIVKYIITPPGRRAEDVQTLLRLDHVEKLRKSLTTFFNKRKTEAAEAERAKTRAVSDLCNALKIRELDRTVVVEKVNEKRSVLGLPPIAELKKDTSFKAGIGEEKGDESKAKPPLRKATALRDLDALIASAGVVEPEELSDARASVASMLAKLKADGNALYLARQHGLIKTGLDLVSKDACPLCDRVWDAEELREHLRQKLLSAAEINELLEEAQKAIDRILAALGERVEAVSRAIQYGLLLKPPSEENALNEYVNSLKTVEAELKRFLEDHSELEGLTHAVTAEWWRVEKRLRLEDIRAAVAALPDESSEAEARDVLIVAQERYERLLDASKLAKEQDRRREIAKHVLDAYNKTATQVLDTIYDKVAKDFTEFYRQINREDEGAFVGALESAPAKLNFNVDFYGRGLFPPGAYHSEGHQDGMGLCLYLALMKHTLGNDFTFAVLDDVLMSVDSGHRREVCRLLKSQFPNTQFVLTTHDRIWLRYMKTEGLIVHSQSFGGWTVDAGPRVWDDNDVWSEIDEALSKNDVARAAWLLRWYLEYMASILADNLRAPVEYRGDGNYDLGDLLPPVLKTWRKRIDDGEKSAIYWKREDEKARLAEARVEAKDLVAKTNTESWAINPSVHFNQWANLGAKEFREVASAFENLLKSMRCPTCDSYLYVNPRKGPMEEMRCSCGSSIINLKKGD